MDKDTDTSANASTAAPAPTSTTQPSYLNSVAPSDSRSAKFMRNDLARSGLVPDDLQAIPLSPSGFTPDAASYRIPYFDITNKPHAKMWRERKAGGVNEQRYTQPSENEIGPDCRYPYIPPATFNLTGKTLVICEGEKKAACVAKYIGLPSLGIGGAGNWRNASGKIQINEWIVAFIKAKAIEDVILVPDADVKRFDLAVQYGTFAVQLRREHVNVKLLAPPGKIDDLIVSWGPEQAKGAFAALPEISSLVESAHELAEYYGLNHTRSAAGSVKLEQNIANVLLLLRQHPAFPEIWYNDDTSQIVFDEQVANMDQQGIDVLEFLQHNLQMPKLSVDVVRRAIKRRAYDNRRSPFRKWLDELKWDGVSRLETMFTSYCGTPDAPFVRDVGNKWLSGAVWRAFEPGCPVDYMLVAKGPQGRGKSTFPTLLWGVDQVVSILGKESQQKDDLSKYHMGKCVSFEEFDTMYVNDVGHLKGIITNRVDTFRKPYDIDNESHPRSCVFYASTNRHQFLKHDDTGYRRFVVVEFLQLDFTAITRDREQLWAEAVNTFRRLRDDNQLFTLSEIANTTAVAAGYAHEEDYITRFEDWKASAVKGLDPGAHIHEGYVYLTVTEAYLKADIAMTKKQEDKRTLKEHMRNTGWEYHDKTWKSVPDKLDGGKLKRLERVYIHRINVDAA